MEYTHNSPGQIIFRRGDAAARIYFILSGKVSLWQAKTEFEINAEIKANSSLFELRSQVDLEKGKGTADAQRIRDLESQIQDQSARLNTLRSRQEEQLLRLEGRQYFILKNFCRLKRTQHKLTGDSFGEMTGSKEQEKRKFTALAVEDCELCVLSFCDYCKIIDLAHAQQIYLYSLLEKQFPDCTIDSMIRLGKSFKEEVYEMNQILWKEDTPMEWVFVVKYGAVKLTKTLRQECEETEIGLLRQKIK